MADVVSTFAALSDQRNASTVTAEYLRLLKDRNALPNHPALYKLESPSSIDATTTIKIAALGLDGYDGFDEPGDGGLVETKGLTDTSFTVSVARQSKAYGPTDLARMTDKQGVFQSATMAQDAVATAATKLVDLVAAILPGFTNTVGTSGEKATVQDHLDAKRVLNRENAEGMLLAIYSSDQWADILDDLLLNASGNVAWIPATAELSAVLGNGYQGRLAGVDVFVSNRVNTANAEADFCGGMFARGAVLWTDATPIVDLPTHQTLIDKVLFELDRVAKRGRTDFVSHYYIGASKGIDAAGVGIVTRKP